jgi:hypothetical protein
MARWQRDPKARRNVAYVLAAAEVLAVTANLYLLFSAYLLQLNLRLSGGVEGLLISRLATHYVAVAATIVCAGAAIVVAVMYARDRAWARRLLIATNGILVGLGVLWFMMDRLGSSPDAMAAVGGLLLPFVTLFPLLWPLLAFRPTMRVASDAADVG